jgi:hypothetical protein
MNQLKQNENPSGLSIAALITGLTGVPIVPIILGAIDLINIKNGTSSSKGKGFDIAGIVLGALIFVVAGIIIIAAMVILALNINPESSIF